MSNGSVIAILMNASHVVQFVLVVLVFFSLLCWAIIFSKWRKIRRALSADEQFQDIFWKADTLEALFRLTQHQEAPMANISLEAYAEYDRLKGRGHSMKTLRGWLDNIERSIEKAIIIELWQLENGIGWLATIGNASPFIGLFGTVWGIMRSFHEIGLRGSATLATVAPGISEALIATAIGLAVAIPAVIAYNWFTGTLSEVEGNLRCFKNDLMNLVERELMLHLTASSRPPTQPQDRTEE